MISNGWRSERLKNVADVSFSTVDKKSGGGELPVRLCNYTDVYYSEEIKAEMNFMEATATTAEARSFGLRAGDLLITKDSETADDIGVPAFVPEILDGVVCGYHLAMLRPKPELIDPKYLFWSISSGHVRQQMTSFASGVTRYGLRLNDVRDLQLSVPDLPTQRSVVHFLDRETARISALVSQKRLLLDELTERRRSVVFHGVTGLLAPGAESHDPGLPWAGAVRKPWPAVKIKHVAQLGSGHTPSRSRPELWEACTIPWITTGEIQQVRDDRAEVITDTREKISALGLANSAAELHPAGTVVLCRTASAGFSAMMGLEMATSQDFATWTCSDRVLPRYLLMCLRAMRPDLQGRLAFGSTHRTIYMPDIEDLKIPLPGVGEQHEALFEIDSRLARIDALTGRLEGQLALLATHRQALITAAVTGEVDAAESDYSASK